MQCVNDVNRSCDLYCEKILHRARRLTYVLWGSERLQKLLTVSKRYANVHTSQGDQSDLLQSRNLRMWRLLRVTRSIFERTLMCGSSSMIIVLKHCMQALRNFEASTANCRWRE
jgi:hypothetical protein